MATPNNFFDQAVMVTSQQQLKNVNFKIGKGTSAESKPFMVRKNKNKQLNSTENDKAARQLRTFKL